MMKQVSEGEYVSFILSLARPNPNGFPRQVPDPATRVFMRGAVSVAEYEVNGKVVARHYRQNESWQPIFYCSGGIMKQTIDVSADQLAAICREADSGWGY
jgi:hypothetical protein